MYSYKQNYSIIFPTSIYMLMVLLFFSTSHNVFAQKGTKINGVNLVSPRTTMPEKLSLLEQVSPNWVSVSPVILLKGNDPTIEYPSHENFEGDSPEMVLALCKKAKQEGYNILLKPLFRVDYHNWAGDFLLNGYLQNLFEANFTKLMMDFAKIAEEENVEMLCLGTELKKFVQMRPSYWYNLIAQIRQVYKGKLTYASNWDNVENIPFWHLVDYIGIDAYYPLVQKETPLVDQLVKAWKEPKLELNNIANQYNKKIIFTEYGYRSIHYAAWKQWEFESTDENISVNLQAQVNGYEAIYQAFWNEPWFAGGFVWKWFIDDPEHGGESNSNYTPQNKPVISVIKQWYSTSN